MFLMPTDEGSGKKEARRRPPGMPTQTSAKRGKGEGTYGQGNNGALDGGVRMHERPGPAAAHAQVRRLGCAAVQGAQGGRESPARRPRQLRDRAELRARAGTQEGRRR